MRRRWTGTALDMKPTYRIKIVRSADKQLLRVPAELRKRLLDAIDELAMNPFHGGVIKLQGIEGHRVRVGSHRILFGSDTKLQLVTVTNVEHRREAYRR